MTRIHLRARIYNALERSRHRPLHLARDGAVGVDDVLEERANVVNVRLRRPAGALEDLGALDLGRDAQTPAALEVADEQRLRVLGEQDVVEAQVAVDDAQPVQGARRPSTRCSSQRR